MANKMKPETQLTGKDFRPNLCIDDIAAFPKDDENYIYKGVIFTYRHKPLNVEDHEKAGYEIVFSKEACKDDRKFSPDSSLEESTVPSPVLKTTTDGHKMVLMRISKEKFNENQRKLIKEYQEHYSRAIGGKISQQGNHISVDGGELNLTNNFGENK